jgi:transcriptional regulator NrdR family protein
MVCIYCQSKTRVINSRLQKKSNKIWRRRLCPVCKNTFTSIEGLQDLSFIVSDTNTPPKPFSRDNLFVSIYLSCGHRANPVSDATALTDTIVAKVLSSIEDGCIAKTDLFAIAESVLKHFDSIASTSYEAYYAPKY